ncbi:MAG: hypothetical protein ACTS2F_30490 [Thainema sp.]
MSSSHLLKQARAGNPDAIAALLNRNLQPREIQATVTHTSETSLAVHLTASQPLSPDKLVSYLHQSFRTLNPTTISSVEIYGHQNGQTQPIWTRQFQLHSPNHERTSPPATTSQNQHRDRPSPSVKPIAKKRRSRGRLVGLWLQWQWATWRSTLLMSVAVLVVFWIIAVLIKSWFPNAFAFPELDFETRSNVHMGISAIAIHSLLTLLCGIFVGDAQASWLKRQLPAVRHWFWGSALGFPLGTGVMLLIMLISGLLSSLSVILLPFWLLLGPTISAIAAGAIIGGLQWLALRNRIPHAVQWLWVSIGSSVLALIGGVLTSGLLVGLPWLMAYNSASTWGAGFLIFMLPITMTVSWLIFHGLTGIKMAYFVYDQTVQPK